MRAFESPLTAQVQQTTLHGCGQISKAHWLENDYHPGLTAHNRRLIRLFQTTGWLQLLMLSLTGFLLSAPWPLSVVMVQEAMPNNVGLASELTLGLWRE
ncbi:MAG: hypothetical protein U0350_26885 [Caldilineaceae bacterium]